MNEDELVGLRHIRVDIYHHFPDGLPITGDLTISMAPPAPLPATHAILVITPTQGQHMPGTITVDTTTETATLVFVDDKGDTDAAAPAGVVVTFASDNTAVATIAPDATNPLMGDVTPVAEGTANISAAMTNADGSPVMEADGVTPFPAIAPVMVTVGPGPAVGASLVLSI